MYWIYMYIMIYIYIIYVYILLLCTSLYLYIIYIYMYTQVVSLHAKLVSAREAWRNDSPICCTLKFCMTGRRGCCHTAKNTSLLQYYSIIYMYIHIYLCLLLLYGSWVALTSRPMPHALRGGDPIWTDISH
jgi:hypothetical protein